MAMEKPYFWIIFQVNIGIFQCLMKMTKLHPICVLVHPPICMEPFTCLLGSSPFWVFAVEYPMFACSNMPSHLVKVGSPCLIIIVIIPIPDPRWPRSKNTLSHLNNCQASLPLLSQPQIPSVYSLNWAQQLYSNLQKTKVYPPVN